MLRTLTLATATTLAAAAPAVAQDTGPRTDLVEAAEIVVTATRHETATFDVPASTSVVSGRDFTSGRLRRTVTDGLLDLPSVMVQKTAYGQASPFIRGFTGYQTLMLVDGIRLNNSNFRSGPNQYWATIDPFTVDRIEVVRGPGSVLHGSDAIGGTVNAVAFGPTGFESGRHLRYHSFARYATAEGSWTLRGEVSGNQGDLAFRAGATYRSYDDLRGGGSSDRLPATAYRDTDGDVRLHLRESDASLWTFGAQHVDQDDVPRTHKTVDAIPFRGTDVGSELSRVLNQTRDLVYVRNDRSDLGSPAAERAVLTLSYHEQRERRDRARDRGRFDSQGVDVRTVGVQAQFETHTSAGFVTYGAEWYHDEVDSFRKDFTRGALTLRRVQGPVADDAQYDLLGVYAQDEFDVGDTTLTAGARWTYAAVDADRVDNPLVGGGDPATPGNIISLDDSWTSLVGSLRAVHPLGESWNAFGGVAQAFRAPNLSDLTRLDATSGREVPSPGLDSEDYVTFEAGLKGQTEDWSLQVAAWRTEIDGMIVPSPTGRVISGTPEVRKSNVGDGDVEGIEVEGSARLGEDWTLAVAWSSMDGEVDQLTPAGRTVSAPLSRLAPNALSTTLTFAPQGDRWNAWVSLRSVGDADELSLKDATDTSRIPAGGTPGYEVLSLGAAWQATDEARVSVVLENATDRVYRIHGSGVNEPGRNLVVAVDLLF